MKSKTVTVRIAVVIDARGFLGCALARKHHRTEEVTFREANSDAGYPDAPSGRHWVTAAIPLPPSPKTIPATVKPAKGRK